MTGQRGLHDLAEGAAIVVRQPVPQRELLRRDHRHLVQHGDDLFQPVVRRRTVHVFHQPAVQLARSELHFHAHTGLHLGDQFVRNGVGVGAFGQREGENDIGVGGHYPNKIAAPDKLRESFIMPFLRA